MTDSDAEDSHFVGKFLRFSFGLQARRDRSIKASLQSRRLRIMNSFYYSYVKERIKARTRI